MTIECSVVTVESEPTAVMDGTTTHANLHLTIGKLIDPVWSFLRGGDVTPSLVPNHNVVLYRGPATGDPFDVEVGVRVDRAFTEVSAEGVRCSELPGGKAARAVHVGPYNRMRETYAMLGEWITSNELESTGVNWEVYGDWDEDPEKLETELFIQLA